MGKTRNSANLVSDNNIFVDIENDRVGIGSTSPTTKLDVSGDINFTGILNQSGSPFVASRWTSGTGDNIYKLDGNVGVGTTNPQYTLEVSGDVSIASTVGIGTIIDIIPYDTLNNGTLSWEGSAGQLFSITNNLTSGSIFSVNDVSGIPSIDVNADGTVSLAPFGGNVGVGTTNPTSKFSVTGNVNVSGIITATTINDTAGDLRDIPQNSKTASYTLIASDAGKHISITTGGVTVPASVFSIGDAVTIFNDSASDQTITQGASVTLRFAGTPLTGDRVLGQYGICNILTIVGGATPTFVIAGAGLT